ncbi:MAG: hypothetical protein BMS9Abin08_0285 [Gammaproteobacteria bacterium]|nr:MAG: hypothetical protein BMS9Abin08_0285 [Gammaproteobacteria bacterium]
MQASIYNNDMRDHSASGVVPVALLVSILAHGLLLWLLTGDVGLFARDAYYADTIFLRLVNNSPVNDVAPAQDVVNEVTANRPETPVVSPHPLPDHATDQDPVQQGARPKAEPEVSKSATLLFFAAMKAAKKTSAGSEETVPDRPEAIYPADAGQPPEPAVSPANIPSRMDRQAAFTVLSRSRSVTDAGFSITPVYAPAPAYPMLARRLGLEGLVLLRVTVGEGGSAGNVEIINSSGHEIFDRAAIDAVRGWRFRVNGTSPAAAASSLDVPIRFRLNQ